MGTNETLQIFSRGILPFGTKPRPNEMDFYQVRFANSIAAGVYQDVEMYESRTTLLTVASIGQALVFVRKWWILGRPPMSSK